jgi:hypothetical protein
VRFVSSENSSRVLILTYYLDNCFVASKRKSLRLERPTSLEMLRTDHAAFRMTCNARDNPCTRRFVWIFVVAGGHVTDKLSDQ